MFSFAFKDSLSKFKNSKKRKKMSLIWLSEVDKQPSCPRCKSPFYKEHSVCQWCYRQLTLHMLESSLTLTNGQHKCDLCEQYDKFIKGKKFELYENIQLFKDEFANAINLVSKLKSKPKLEQLEITPFYEPNPIPKQDQKLGIDVNVNVDTDPKELFGLSAIVGLPFNQNLDETKKPVVKLSGKTRLVKSLKENKLIDASNVLSVAPLVTPLTSLVTPNKLRRLSRESSENDVKANAKVDAKADVKVDDNKFNSNYNYNLNVPNNVLNDISNNDDTLDDSPPILNKKRRKRTIIDDDE